MRPEGPHTDRGSGGGAVLPIVPQRRSGPRPRRLGERVRRFPLFVCWMLGLASLPTASWGAEPAIAQPGLARAGQSAVDAKGVVFFLRLDGENGVAAVGTAHTLRLDDLARAGRVEFFLPRSLRRVAASERFLVPPGRPFSAPGASLGEDFVVYALAGPPKGVRSLEPASEIQVAPGLRVFVLGPPRRGHRDEQEIFGTVAQANSDRIEFDLDVSQGLAGWGGAPVLHVQSERVIGLVEASVPSGQTTRVHGRADRRGARGRGAADRCRPRSGLRRLRFGRGAGGRRAAEPSRDGRSPEGPDTSAGHLEGSHQLVALDRLPARRRSGGRFGVRQLRRRARDRDAGRAAPLRRGDGARHLAVDHRPRRDRRERQRRGRRDADGSPRLDLRRPDHRSRRLDPRHRGSGGPPAAARSRPPQHPGRAGRIRGRSVGRKRAPQCAEAGLHPRAPDPRPSAHPTRSRRSAGHRARWQHPHGGRRGPGHDRAAGPARLRFPGGREGREGRVLLHRRAADPPLRPGGRGRQRARRAPGREPGAPRRSADPLLCHRAGSARGSDRDGRDGESHAGLLHAGATPRGPRRHRRAGELREPRRCRSDSPRHRKSGESPPRHGGRLLGGLPAALPRPEPRPGRRDRR